ncbi:MAG: alanine glycine permease, partial [Pseudomonadota bacterium]
MNIDEQVNAIVGPLANFVSNVIFFKVPLMGADLPLVVIWLVAAAVFFTLYFGFINIRGFGHALELVRGQVGSRKNPPGEVSHFQALATAVSGTVGIGNIG